MINNYPFTNIYEKRFKKSKLASQMLYGEKFKVIKQYKDFYKIRTSYDNYIGYVKKKKFKENLNPTHKIKVLKSYLYSQPKKRSKLKTSLGFCSKIRVKYKTRGFSKFDNYWIRDNDLIKINHKIKLFSNIRIFENVKYKWGGKGFKGIDCSAFIQLFFKFNNIFFPRDTKDQFKFLKKNKKIKKNSLIYWRGHVALCLNKKKLIHAYGPKKKVLIMNINNTINEIKNNSDLKVIGIK